MEYRLWEEDEGLVRKLYRNVENTTEIRKLIFNAKLPFALINPKVVVDPFQLSVAVTKALFNVKEQSMTTRSLATEIIYALSPSKNISESLKQYSTQDGDTEFLIVGDKLMFPKIGEQIKGEEMALETLAQSADVPLVKQLYQIGEEEEDSLLDAIVSRMAAKEFQHLSWSNNAISSS